MKKIKIYLMAGFLVSLLTSIAYIVMPEKFMSLDNKLRDIIFLVRGELKPSKDIVIVDIDEKSLKELGQWPWKRKDVATILQNLTNAGVGVIGLDIVFAEYDNSNPVKVLKELGRSTEGIEDYEEILAKTIASTPTILGYIFVLGDDGIKTEGAPSIPATYIEKHKPQREFIAEAKRAILNVPIVQENAYSSGFFNTFPDSDGLVRSVPLVMKYDGAVYPSLAMEMVRVMTQADKVYVNYAEDIGVQNVRSGSVEIPTDSFGRMFVNFRGPAFSYRYISASDIYSGNFKPEDVEGKFVLIGTSAAGLMDLRAMPFDSVYPGVEVHANAIDNIIAGDFISKPSWVMAADITQIFLVGITLSILFGMLSAVMTLFVLIIVVLLQLSFIYYMLFYQGIALNILFNVVILSLSIYIISMVLNYFLETKQKNMIKGKFASKVSADVMEDILKNPDSNTLDGAEKEITVFFSDVRGFTNISEAMGNPKSLIKFMNEIMEPMTSIIIDERGTVDKYIGDAIMAYWNAPVSVENHADRAVTASLRQLHKLKSLNEELRSNPEFENVTKMADKAKVPIVDIGIGLNSGVAIVGEMGSTIRSDYTVIGDPINVGARLESLCKYYNSRLNISNFTKNKLTGKYIYRFLDLVTVKGKVEPLEIWQIHDFDREGEEPLFYSSRERLLAELHLYHQAIDLYKSEKFEEALAFFKELNGWEDKSNIKIYDIYIERCEHYMEFPPQNFNGVFVHTTKG
ncbi:MAG: adenylate/guanylate cyclase domain-containing protein [Sulfurimonas sp.]